MSSFNAQLRAQTVRTLETMAERYPNLRLGQLLSNAIAGQDMFNIEDEALALALNQMFITLTQFEAAGINLRRKV